MELKKIKRIIQIIIYGIFGIISAIIFIRMLLRFLGANEEALFVNLWYELSYIFVGMFSGIYPNVSLGGVVVFETFSFVALIFYLILAFIFSRSATSVAESSLLKVIKNIVDVLFKVTEFLLLTRFLFKLTGASENSIFVNFIYKISALVYEPFQNIFPTIRIEDYNFVFETSTLIAIVIIIIFDIITEGIIDKIAEEINDNRKNKYSQPQMHSNGSGQNITINIPQPPRYYQPTPQYVDQRTIHVHTNDGVKTLKAHPKGTLASGHKTNHKN